MPVKGRRSPEVPVRWPGPSPEPPWVVEPGPEPPGPYNINLLRTENSGHC